MHPKPRNPFTPGTLLHAAAEVYGVAETTALYKAHVQWCAQQCAAEEKVWAARNEKGGQVLSHTDVIFANATEVNETLPGSIVGDEYVPGSCGLRGPRSNSVATATREADAKQPLSFLADQLHEQARAGTAQIGTDALDRATFEIEAEAAIADPNLTLGEGRVKGGQDIRQLQIETERAAFRALSGEEREQYCESRTRAGLPRWHSGSSVSFGVVGPQEKPVMSTDPNETARQRLEKGLMEFVSAWPPKDGALAGKYCLELCKLLLLAQESAVDTLKALTEQAEPKTTTFIYDFGPYISFDPLHGGPLREDLIGAIKDTNMTVAK